MPFIMIHDADDVWEFAIALMFMAAVAALLYYGLRGHVRKTDPPGTARRGRNWVLAGMAIPCALLALLYGDLAIDENSLQSSLGHDMLRVALLMFAGFAIMLAVNGRLIYLVDWIWDRAILKWASIKKRLRY